MPRRRILSLHRRTSRRCIPLRLLSSRYSASHCHVASRRCVVASSRRVAASRRVSLSIPLCSRRHITPRRVASSCRRVSLLHRCVASHRRHVLSLHPTCASRCIALLRVSSPHRVSSSSHLVVALPRRVSSSDIESVDGIVHLPFEAVERAVNVVGHFN
jgi:hypothetical protein